MNDHMENHLNSLYVSQTLYYFKLIIYVDHTISSPHNKYNAV